MRMGDDSGGVQKRAEDRTESGFRVDIAGFHANDSLPSGRRQHQRLAQSRD